MSNSNAPNRSVNRINVHPGSAQQSPSVGRTSAGGSMNHPLSTLYSTTGDHSSMEDRPAGAEGGGTGTGGTGTGAAPEHQEQGEETQDDPCKITIRAEGSDGHHYEDTVPDIGLSVWFHLKECQNYLNFVSKLKHLLFDIKETSHGNIEIRYTGSATLANNTFMSKCREVHQIIRENTEKYCQITIIEDEEQKDFIVRKWTKTGLSQSRKATAHRARSGCLFIVAENHYRNDVDREVLKLKEQYKVYAMQLQGDVGNLSAAEGNCNWPVQPEVNARSHVNWEPVQELLEEEDGIGHVLLQTTILLTSCQQKFLDSQQEAKNYVVSFFNKKDIQCAFDFNDGFLVLTAKKELQPITTSVLEDLVISRVLPFTSRYWYSKKDVLGLMEEKFQSSKGKFMFFPDDVESSVTVVATNDIFPHIYNVIHMITVDVVEKTIELDREQFQHLLLMKKWEEFEPLLVGISENVVLIRTLHNDKKRSIVVLGTNAIVEEFCSEIEGLVSSNTCMSVITKLSLPADKIQLLHTRPAAVKFIEQAVKKEGYEVRVEGKDVNISSHSSIHLQHLQHFQDLIISETIMQQDESVSDLLTLDELKDMLIKAHQVHQEKIVIVIDKMKQSLTLTGTVDIFSDVREHLREIQTMFTKTEEEFHLSADHMDYIRTQGKSELETVAHDVKVSVEVAEYHGKTAVKLTGLQPGVKKVKEWLTKNSTVMGRKKMSQATSQVFQLQGLMQKLLKTCPKALYFIQEEYKKKGYRFHVDPELRNATVIVNEPEELSNAIGLVSFCTKKLSVDFAAKRIQLTPTQAKDLLCEHEPEYSQQMVLHAHDSGNKFMLIGTRDIAGQVIKTFEQILYDHAFDSICLYLVGEENSVPREELEKMKQEKRSQSVAFLCISEKVEIHGAKASVRDSFRTLCSSLAELKQNGKIQVPPRLRMCDQDVSQLIHLALQKCGGIRQYLTFHFEKHGFDFELSDNRLRLYAGSITALQTVREIFESLILERNFSLLDEAVVQMHGMQYVAAEVANNPSWEGKLITHTDDESCQLSIVCTDDIKQCVEGRVHLIKQLYQEQSIDVGEKMAFPLETTSKQIEDELSLREPDLKDKFRIFNKDGKIHFVAASDCMASVKKKLKQMLVWQKRQREVKKDQASKDLRLTELELEFIMKPEVVNYIDDKLKHYQFKLSADGKSMLVCCLKPSNLDTAVAEVKDCIKNTTFDMSNEPLRYNLSPDDLKKMLDVQEVLHGGKLLIKVDAQRKLLFMVYTDDVQEVVLSKLEEIKTTCSDMTEVLPFTKEVWDQVKMIYPEDLHTIETEDVKLQYDAENGIEVTGHKDKVDQATTKLKAVAQKVHHEPFSFPEGTDILQTQEGQELLRKIEKRDGCMITLQENKRETDPQMADNEFLTMLHMKQTHDCVKLSQWTSNRGSSITVIQGSTKDMCAGTLVVPVVRGVLPQDFGHVTTDPALREKLENMKKARDDPIWTDGSHLKGIKCNSVVFFNIPSTLKDGKDKEKNTVHETVKNIIKQAGKKTSSRDIGLVFVLETIFKEGLDAAGVKCIIRGAQEAFKEMTSSIDVQLLTDGRNSSDVMKTLENAGKVKASVSKQLKNIGKKLKPGKDKPREQSKTLIKIAVGRLEKRKVDVLVNSAHQMLDLKQGVVSRALNEATNGQLQRECAARFPNGIRPGEVAITNFQVHPSTITSKVFHGTLWKYPHGNQSDVTEQECWQVMQEFIYNCLCEANKLGVMSIAFPILGAGTLKHPAKRVAEVMFDSVEWFISVFTTSSIKLVEFVVYEGDKDIIQLFTTEYMSRSYHAKSFTQGVTARETRHVCGNVMLQFIQSDISKCEGMTDGLVCIWENSQLQDPSKHPIVGQHLKTIEWNLYAQDMKDSGLTKTKGDGLPANIIFHTLLTDFKTTLSKGLKSAVDNHCSTVQFGVMAQGKTHDTKSLVADIVNILKSDDITCKDLCLFTVVVADEECYTSIVQQLKKSQGFLDYGYGFLKTALATVWPTGSQAVELATEVNDVGAQLVVSGTSAEHCKAVYEKVVEEMKQIEQVLNHNTPVTDGGDGSSVDDMTHPMVEDDTETKQKVFGKCTAELENIVIRDGNWMQMKGELETFDLIIQKREGGQTYLEGSFSSLSKAHTLLCKQGYMSVASNDETYAQEENKDTGKDSGITITKVHYDAVMHLIGGKELERFCQFEDTSSGDKKVCFIQGPGHLDEVQTLQQRIQGVIQDEIDLSKLEQVDVSKDKAVQVAKAVMTGIQDVYVKYAEDRKAMIMFAEDWNKMSRAKKLIPLQFGQGKPVSRLKRKFAAPDTSDKLDSTKHGSISVVKESGSIIPKGRNFTVKVYNESIVSLELDVIVNAANGHLSHGGGVARIIASAAGRQLEDEGNSIVLQRGDIPVTDLAVTNSGNLPCKRVFHAVGPRWNDYTDKEWCLEDLCCTILRCLCEAVNRSFETIAFPSISSSIFAVPKDACAKMYVRALKSFDTVVERGSLKEVHFVDVSDIMVNIIQTELQNTWSQPGKKENLTKDRAFIMKCLDSNTSASVTTLEVTPGEHKEKDNNAGAHWLGKSGSVSLRVVKDDILKVDAHAILSWVDIGFSTTRPLHKLMNDAGGESYRRGRESAHRMHKSWGDIAEGPGGSLAPKHVIFAIISSSAQNEDISKCLKKALDCCVKNKLTNLILTKPFSKSAHGNLDITFIETTVDQLIKLDQDERKPTLHVQIVDDQQHVVDGLMQRLQQYLISCGLAATAITSKETEVQGGEDCVICLSQMTDPVKLKCGHQFCKQCVDKSFKIKAVCPVCKMKCGEITGNMPPGTMRDRVEYYTHLPGYNGCGTIIITYAFNGGHQTEEHPDKGKWYDGIARKTYLPNNAEGQKVLSLLKVAWKRRLTFTIGRSVTMGKDSCITWNEIHHKTNTSGGPTNHGYPDLDYLRRVQEELADQGVTEEDLGATGTSV